MLFGLYRGFTRLFGPLAPLILARRAARGKEDPARRGERLGTASTPRPDGKLVWIHAASVGEAQSAQILIDRLLAGYPGLGILMTTGTVTSATLLAKRLPHRVIHQFVPIDRPDCVGRFFDHWRPDAVIWLESELWPNKLHEISRRAIPAILANARLSPRSFARWSRAPSFAKKLLDSFDLILPGDSNTADRLRALGGQTFGPTGNLKYSAEPLAADPAALNSLNEAIGDRPVWLAASTHPGEEALMLDAHRRLAAQIPNLLTLLAPRHPDRGEEVEALIRSAGLSQARRSNGQLPQADTDVYLADTLGELGLFYRLSPLVFVGGSLVSQGGHNPVEPALLDCAILTGPHTENFADIFAEMISERAVRQIPDGPALADAVSALLADDGSRKALAKAAGASAQTRSTVIDRAMGAMAPILLKAGLEP